MSKAPATASTERPDATYVRFNLHSDLLREFDAVAELAGRTRTFLLNYVVGQWLAGARELPPARSVDELSAEEREKVRQKERVVKGWREARAEARRSGQSIDQATAQFLRRLLVTEKLSVSRRSLFNWDRQYRARGLAGFLDGRANPRPQRASEAPSKGVQHRLKRTKRKTA